MNSVQYGRGKPYVGHPRNMGIRQNHYRQTSTGFPSQKFSGNNHLPVLEASFLECLCVGCRANYLVFKDLDRNGVSFFPKEVGMKRITPTQLKPSENKSWFTSKRDTPSSPVLFIQRREMPLLKKANTGQTSEPHEDTKHEEFTLVKGVPDWFLKQVKPDLFQGYENSTRSGNKTFKSPSSNSGNWVLIRDPKSIPQMVPLLLRTHKRKL
ncbi:hypothetical protein RHMOL_Rhmol13G0188100 [Rhododendron molle]|uniref:Uncharacterized protein n=1 Tax=Rhododendron molle TaxID=49168 RepID=A0ACC0L8P8_RHOML|nr:hypothetical protein RHMOL_Rhmol13G0188100 [Rhododendron molle]